MIHPVRSLVPRARLLTALPAAICLTLSGVALPVAAATAAPAPAHASARPAVLSVAAADRLALPGLHRQTSGPCRGEFVLTHVGKRVTCSHGVDTDVLAAAPAPNHPAIHAATASAPTPPACVGNGSDGNRVQMVYAYVNGRPNNSGSPTVINDIETEANNIDTEFANSAADAASANAGHVAQTRSVRWVQDPTTCNVTIETVVTASPSFTDVMAAVRAQLPNASTRSDRHYLVYLDDSQPDCIAEIYADSNANPSNPVNGNLPGGLIGMVAAPSWNVGSYCPEHELMHTMGAVNDDAPNSAGDGHCTDQYDTMCFPTNSAPTTKSCWVQTPWTGDFRYDCGFDDYFNPLPDPAFNAKYTYIATHWNTAYSTFLNGLPPLVWVDDISADEGQSGTTPFTFTITRSDTSAAASVVAATADGTATAASGDYTALAPTTVSFAAGQATAQVTVAVHGDTLAEPDETFFLNLSSPNGFQIQDPQAMATIVNDDAPVNDSFANATALSGATGTLSGTIENATLQAGEPKDANGDGTTVWYSWTTGSGPASVTLCGSPYASALMARIYTGNSVTALTAVPSNNGNVSCPDGVVQAGAAFTAAPGTTYRIQIDGYNNYSGAFTLNWSGTATAPGAPRTVRATSASTSAVTVTWTPPTSDGGSAITGYTVKFSNGTTAATATGDATSATVAGLTKGAPYAFRVSATNSIGAGPTSALSNTAYPGTVQENAIVFNGWAWHAAGRANGGAYRSSSTKNGTASFRFTGNSVTLLAIGSPGFGNAGVSIDGVGKGYVNLYRSLFTPVSFTYSGLTNAAHTITVTMLGTKDSRSTGTTVGIDGFSVGGVVSQEESPAINYSGWTGAANPAASGGQFRSSATTGKSATFAWTGTSVRLITATGPAFGKVTLSVDGRSLGTFDLYSSSVHYQSALSFAGLTNAAHTLTITVTGTHNPASRGNSVVVDGVVGY